MNAMLTSANDAHLVSPPRQRLIDAVAVRRVVSEHCRKIGCDESNTRAAIAWALNQGTCTMDACVQGKRRGDVLRARQPDPKPSPTSPVAA